MVYRTGCPSMSKTAGILTIPLGCAGYAQIGEGLRLIHLLKKASKTPKNVLYKSVHCSMFMYVEEMMRSVSTKSLILHCHPTIVIVKSGSLQ